MLGQEERTGQKLACGKYKKTVGINRAKPFISGWKVSLFKSNIFVFGNNSGYQRGEMR